jgi:perosamine synthetase
LVPSLTFVATANAIVHAGGVPHFVDCDDTTLGVSSAALRAHLETTTRRQDDALYNRDTGRRIAALLPVHIFGHPVDMDALNILAAEYGIAVIEDATESLGSQYKGRACGSLAPLATLSFNGNKIVTTGGGGAILTPDRSLAKRIKHITTTAKLPHRWNFVHDEPAWNFRLPNLNAALGMAQLERLPEMLAAKRRLHQRYTAVFSDLRNARIFQDAAFARSNDWLVSLSLDPGQEAALEPILSVTNDAGISTRPAWTPMHLLIMYRENPRAPLPVTESLARRIINLPSSPFLMPL